MTDHHSPTSGAASGADASWTWRGPIEAHLQVRRACIPESDLVKALGMAGYRQAAAEASSALLVPQKDGHLVFVLPYVNAEIHDHGAYLHIKVPDPCELAPMASDFSNDDGVGDSRDQNKSIPSIAAIVTRLLLVKSALSVTILNRPTVLPGTSFEERLRFEKALPAPASWSPRTEIEDNLLEERLRFYLWRLWMLDAVHGKPPRSAEEQPSWLAVWRPAGDKKPLWHPTTLAQARLEKERQTAVDQASLFHNAAKATAGKIQDPEKLLLHVTRLHADIPEPGFPEEVRLRKAMIAKAATGRPPAPRTDPAPSP